MCAVRSFAWMIRTCPFRRCSLVPPWPPATRPRLQDSQDCYSDDKPEVLSPGAVAVLYRALRKGREDIKDEPGAADFYY
jgi:hypothetical protein